jgi:hypothetical protein
MFLRSLCDLLGKSVVVRALRNSGVRRRRFQPHSLELETRIVLSEASNVAYEIAYLGDLGAKYTGPVLVYLAGGSNPIDAEEWANYTPPPGYIKNTPRNLQFNAQTLISSPDSMGDSYITTSDVYTWLFIASTVSANWPFNPADYPGQDYSSGYEAAALETTPPPGVIKWTDNTKNQEITWYATDADGQPIERYFITDPWGDRFIMQASGVTDTSQVESNFLSAVLPAGWKRSMGNLNQDLTTLPAYNADGTANYNIFRDSADDSFEQIGWGKLGWGTAQMISGMPIWGGTNGNTIRTNPAFNNLVYAAGGNDTIYAADMINTIHGDGEGDTAIFPGRRCQYTITTSTSDDSTTIVTRRGSAASTHVTTLYGVERIRFANPKLFLVGIRGRC